VENLRVLRVLRVVSEARLVINWSKCQFLQQRVEFLGHIIKDGCMSPFEHKIEAVRTFSKPKTIKQVQSFLGLSGHFRKFVSQYSIITRLLTNLLKARQNSSLAKRIIHIFKGNSLR